MSALALFIYSIAAFGLAFIVGHSKISLPLRMVIDPGEPKTVRDAFRTWLLILLECPACLGWWAGLVAGFYLKEPPLLLALYTTGSNLLLAKLAGLLEEEGK